MLSWRTVADLVMPPPLIETGALSDDLSDVCLPVRLPVCLPDVCLSGVCLSRTSGLSREQRGLGRLKLAHVTRTPLSRSKGQGHQAALLTAVLMHQPAADLPLRCGLQARWREALRRPQKEERGGAYCGGRPPTACYSIDTAIVI